MSHDLDTLLEQVVDASSGEHYYLALMAALTIPDVCAALGDSRGRTSGAKYSAWVAVNLRDEMSGEHWDEASAKLLYRFRCGILHEGSLLSTRDNIRLAFAAPRPGAGRVHNMLLDAADDGQFLVLDLGFFCNSMVASARTWLASEETDLYQRNAEKLVRRHPAGPGGMLRIEGSHFVF